MINSVEVLVDALPLLVDFYIEHISHRYYVRVDPKYMDYILAHNILCDLKSLKTWGAESIMDKDKIEFLEKNGYKVYKTPYEWLQCTPEEIEEIEKRLKKYKDENIL